MSDFPKKWENALPPGFKSDAETYSDDELRQHIVKCNRSISITEQDMDDDQELALAKEKVKELAAPFKESIKSSQAQARYCVYLMSQRGIA